MTTFIQQIFNALAIGAIYLLVALGITLLYGLMRLVNFTQGLLAGLGAFVVFELAELGLPLVASLAIASAAIGLGSLVLLVGLFQRTLTRPFNGFVISLALITALPAAYALIWPADTYSIPTSLSGVWEINGVFLDQRKVLLIAVTVVATGGLVIVLRATQFGRGVRAIADNLVAARVLGVPVALLTAGTFVIGCALAALAGGLLGVSYPFNAYTGDQYLLEGFAVAVVGGLGSVGGAVVAALILSMSETLGGAYVSLEWAPVFSLTAIVVVILLRPRGLFGTTEAGETLGTSEAALSIAEDPYAAQLRARDRSPAWHLAEEVMRWAKPIAAIVLLVAVPWILPTQRLLSLAIYAVVIAIATYGIWFLFRYAGVLSIAQAAFMGVGAYATALSISHWNLNFWLQLPLATAAAAVVSLIMGAIALRTRGSYFLIIVFAMTQLVVEVVANWQSLTGGHLGLINVVPAQPFGTAGDFWQLEQQYWLALGFLGVTVGAMFVLSRTAFTRRLTTVRDNELLAESVGLNTFRHQLIAFTIAGAIGGLAGVMFLYQQSALQPELFGIWPGAALILVLLLGGSGVLAGPIIGAFLLTFLPEILGLGPNTTQLVNGLLLIAVILFLPRGVGGSVRLAIQRLLARITLPKQGLESALRGDAP